MSTPKPNRRKAGSKKLEPIDWHEYANDAVLHGNMSTLYHRPATEDPSAYASAEALLEIEKRVAPRQKVEPDAVEPTVSSAPTVGTEPPVHGAAPDSAAPTVGIEPTGSLVPTVGPSVKKKIKPIRDLQDALTLAGQVLFKTMYGSPDGSTTKSCTKGYRQLAAESHLDKDTVRDLISEFKEKGIVRETGTYDPDTRSAKTYEISAPSAVLRMWRNAGICYVTVGRQRPVFCTAEGIPVGFRPTVGPRERCR